MNKFGWFLLAVTLAFTFIYHSYEDNSEGVSKNKEGDLLVERSYTPKHFSESEICRAGIASIMLQDYDKTQLTNSDSGIHSFSYTRDVDNTIWEYRCRLDGNQIVWRGNALGDSEGPWRNRPADIVYLFEEDENKLSIFEIYPDYPDYGEPINEYERSGSSLSSI